MITISFSEYLASLTETLHPELQAIADGAHSIDAKNKLFAAKIKSLTKSGEDTGLDGTKGTGSSRVFYPHKEHHEITLDGQKVKVPVGTKFAKRFSLDAHTGHGNEQLLGQMQNRAESDAGRFHGLFQEDQDGKFHTREDGVVAPILHSHDDYDHITAVKAEKFSASEFQKITKTDEHPKGVKFKEFHDTLMRDHDRSNGKYHDYSTSHEKMDALEEHPTVSAFLSHQQDTQHHPGDISPRNMGIITHPITGKKHPVLVDAGFDRDAQKSYQQARIRQSRMNRGY